MTQNKFIRATQITEEQEEMQIIISTEFLIKAVTNPIGVFLIMKEGRNIRVKESIGQLWEQLNEQD